MGDVFLHGFICIHWKVSFVSPDVDFATTFFLLCKSNAEISTTDNFDKPFIILSLLRDLGGDVLINFVANAELTFVVPSPCEVLMVAANCNHMICSAGDTFNEV